MVYIWNVIFFLKVLQYIFISETANANSNLSFPMENKKRDNEKQAKSNEGCFFLLIEKFEFIVFCYFS